MKNLKAIVLTLVLLSTALHTLQAQKGSVSRKERKKQASTLQLIPTAYAGENVITWNKELYSTINHSTFRQNPLFLQAVDVNNPDYALLNACLLFMVNEERAKVIELSPLAYACQLEVASWHHSKKMGEGAWLNHDNPKEKSRRRPDDRARLAGISNPFIAENIAMLGKGFVSKGFTYLNVGEYLMDMWMHSAGHRANILSKDAMQVGCGVYKTSSGEWYATQKFQLFEPIKSTKAIDELPH